MLLLLLCCPSPFINWISVLATNDKIFCENQLACVNVYVRLKIEWNWYFEHFVNVWSILLENPSSKLHAKCNGNNSNNNNVNTMVCNHVLIIPCHEIWNQRETWKYNSNSRPVSVNEPNNNIKIVLMSSNSNVLHLLIVNYAQMKIKMKVCKNKKKRRNCLFVESSKPIGLNAIDFELTLCAAKFGAAKNVSLYYKCVARNWVTNETKHTHRFPTKIHSTVARSGKIKMCAWWTLFPTLSTNIKIDDAIVMYPREKERIEMEGKKDGHEQKDMSA